MTAPPISNAVVYGRRMRLDVVITRQVERFDHRLDVALGEKRANVGLVACPFGHGASRVRIVRLAAEKRQERRGERLRLFFSDKVAGVGDHQGQGPEVAATIAARTGYWRGYQ